MKPGWKENTLEDLVTIVGGGTPSKRNDKFWNGDIPWVSPKDMKSEIINDSINHITSDAIGKSSAKLIDPGAVLIVVRSGILARKIPVGVTTRSTTVNQDIKALIPNQKILPEFLLKLMQASEKYLLEKVSKGATVHRLQTDSIKGLKVFLPPLEEQRRIVDVLDKAFVALSRALSNTEFNLSKIDNLLRSTLDKLVLEGSSNVSTRKLKNVTLRLTNGYVGPTRNIYQKDGVPYLLARHVKDNVLTFDGRTFVTEDFNDKNKKSKLKTDDVVLVQSGHIGHCAVVDKRHEGHNCHAMIVLSTDKNILSGEYLATVFATGNFKQKFQNIRTGSTVPHLTCKMVKELDIPIVSREEQLKISKQFSQLKNATNDLRESYIEKIENLSDLRGALLKRAFDGELT